MCGVTITKKKLAVCSEMSPSTNHWVIFLQCLSSVLYKDVFFIEISATHGGGDNVAAVLQTPF